MLMVNDELAPGKEHKAEARAAEVVNPILRWVYRIPVVGWGLEGVFADPRPKARAAGAFVLIGGPLAAVLMLGWWGTFLPVLTLAALSVFAIALVLDT